MTFHIDPKTMKGEFRVDPTTTTQPINVVVHGPVGFAGKLASDDVAGYRAGACPAISIAADEWARRQAIRESLPTDADRAPYRPTVSPVSHRRCARCHAPYVASDQSTTGRASSCTCMADSEEWWPSAVVDLSQCNNLHRQKALAAHKHAIATAETDKIERPKRISGIGWDVIAFWCACALLGMALLAGVVGVLS